MFTLLFAQALAQDLVKYDANSIVEHGTTPDITFRIQESGEFGFTLDCGVKRWSLPRQGYTMGASRKMELTGIPLGDHHCVGAIDIQMADGRSGTLNFELPVRSLKPLTWKTNDEDYHPKERYLLAHASRDLATAKATFIGADGQTLEETYAELDDPKTPKVSWTTREEVLKIVLDAKDTLGATSQLILSPWSYRIPHDDVVFATNDSAITPAEEPKLEATWGDIQSTLDKYGDVVKIQLYVAGYTDTVGSPSSNHALSERRARSIAAWFRQRGFTGGIHYQGFGESVLAVATADNVDEEANRRALYVLAAGAPRTSDAIPKNHWKPL